VTTTLSDNPRLSPIIARPLKTHSGALKVQVFADNMVKAHKTHGK
jgi:hypothetical protein